MEYRTQLPDSVIVSEVLMEHTWDATYQENKRKKKEQSNKDKESKEDKKEELELSFAQLENACYVCGKKGHTSNRCYKKDSTPRDQWYINKLQKQELAKMQQHVPTTQMIMFWEVFHYWTQQRRMNKCIQGGR